MRLHPSAVAAFASIAFAAAPAALAQKDPVAGFGAIQVGPLDLEAATMNNGALGVVELDGEYFVASRGDDEQPPHTIYVYSRQGALLRELQQPPPTRFSPWGFRDGCTDGRYVAFGYEDGIQVIDPVDGNSVQQFAGQSVPSPITVPGFAVHRGLAFDPNGDAGRGSFWVGDFSIDLHEVDLQGSVLRTVSPPAAGPVWSVYGLAWDDQGTAAPGDDTLWISSAANQAEIRELDPRTGQYTGNTITRAQATTAQGGLDGVAGPFGSFALVGIDQGPTDTLTIYRVDRDSQVRGEREAVLLSSVGTGALTTESPKFYNLTPGNISFRFDLSADPSLAGRPGLLVFNAGFALPNLVYPGYEELVALLSPAVLLSTSLSQSTTTIAVPSSLPLASQVRMQAVYAEFAMRSNFLVPTNQVFWERRRVEVSAAGNDAYNADTTSGFFQVTNLDSRRITEVILDWTTSKSTAVSTAEFDTDQGGTGGRFDRGNSAMSGCRGTYRNASHVATGLVFDGLNTVIGAPCNPSANCGWIGTNPGTDPGDYRTLRFRFNDFGQNETFEFDCDVDLGGASGLGGDGMAGLMVTVRLQDGTTFGPAPMAGLVGQNRSVVAF